ncbi:MAG TPA: tetratricopeptide repeat protein [Candidatus Obscuribacterales bacterium]
MNQPQSNTTSDRTCDQCGLSIPAGLTECPHNEGEILVARAEKLVGTFLAGQYEITALVGIGGMSAVYKARDRYLDRVVAIKLLHSHLAAHPASLRRFEHEAKAVSHLVHPNIVSVFGYGISPRGEPYLIMDYLAGTSLAGLLREKHRLPPARALELFLPVCDALALAHKKGILHRDIKPSNIMLITDEQGSELVKLVDFGLAKLLPGADIEAPRLTQTGEIFGSPLYMSPEQVMGHTLDARSDIYSLGCVMYEVLSGEPPFVGDNIMETMYRRVSEEAPPLARELAIPRELETAVLVALSREPGQRYRSMDELKQDLELIRQGDAGRSRRLRGARKLPTARIKKVVSRALPVAAAAAMLISGIVTWKTMSARAPEEHDSPWLRFDSEGQKLLDQGSFAGAERLLVAAVKEAEHFGEQDRRLIASLEKLARAYRAQAKNKDAAKAESRIAVLKEHNRYGEQGENLDELAELTLSLVPATIAKHDQGESRHLAEKLNRLGTLCMNQKSYERAEELLQSALTLENKTLEPDDAVIARTLTVLAVLYGSKVGRYDLAEPLLNRAMDIRMRTLGPTHPEVAYNLYNLADLYEAQGQFSKAEESYEKALEIYERAYGRNATEVAMTLSGLGGLYRSRGKFEEAEPLLKEALRIYRSNEGSDKVTLAYSMNNLAGLYFSEAKYDAALPLYEQALGILEKSAGVEHPSVAMLANNLGLVYYKQGNYAKAEPLLRRALSIRQRSLPPGHPQIAQSLNSMAELYRSQRRYAEAAPLYDDALAIAGKALGENHPDVVMISSGLAHLYEDQGKLQEANNLYKKVLSIKKEQLGDSHPEVANTLDDLARIADMTGRPAEAPPLLSKALKIREDALGPDHPDVANTLDRYAALLYRANKPGDAFACQSRAWAIRLHNFLRGG